MTTVITSGALVIRKGERLTIPGKHPLTFAVAEDQAAAKFDGRTVLLLPHGGQTLNAVTEANSDAIRKLTLRYVSVSPESSGSTIAVTYTLLESPLD